MLKRKWKNTIIISVAIVVLAIIVGVFSIVIINTPNLNSYINISAKDVLGSVEINIKNADNGTPYSCFTFENTTSNEKQHEFNNKNLLFKSNTSSITIEFVIRNMSYFPINVNLQFDGPGKNSKLQMLVNNVESEITNNIVIEPSINLENPKTTVVSYVISKQDVKKPIRATFSVEMKLTKLVN